jgi:hypothetical protein
MKNLSNILRRSSITPLERVTVLVHNDIHREKTGKDALSDSDLFVLTKAWNPGALEVKEYNRYINVVRLESSMEMDARMFLHMSEIALLRNQRVLEGALHNSRRFQGFGDQEFTKDIPKKEATQLLTQSTYLEYQKILHIFTFNNLPKEIQDDLLLLDSEVTHNKEYLEEQVFLYERFKNGDVLSKQDKDLIISRIYSCMYYEGVKRIRKSTQEKEGYLLHHFFAELPTKDVFVKLADDAHLTYSKEDGDSEENLLSAVEEYAKSKNMSIESLVKEMLSRWLDEGLFVNEHSPLFMSECFDTWNGNTKKNHVELFMAWYTELQKSKHYFQNLFDTGKLEKQELERSFLGMPRTIEIVTGSSLYACTENINLVREYKEQIEMLLPLANMFLFVKKYAYPVKRYKTLNEFKNMAQKLSVMFDIDMTEKYDVLVEAYKEEVVMINHSLSGLVDMAVGHLYTEKSLCYILDIAEGSFAFDLETDDNVAEIAEKYSEEFKKLGV